MVSNKSFTASDNPLNKNDMIIMPDQKIGTTPLIYNMQDTRSDVIYTLQRILPILNKGGTMIYPTDTLYGLGCDAENTKAVKKIFEIKKRNETKMISVIANFEHIKRVAYLTEKQTEILYNLLPGPYTFLLKPKKRIPYVAEDRIGVRLPDTLFCKELANLIELVVTTSANKSGMPPAYSFEKLDHEILKKVDVVINGGVCKYQGPSTVIDLINMQIVREGVNAEKVYSILNEYK